MITALVSKTGVGHAQLEALIKSHATTEIPRAITELSNQEIAKEYGSDRETLIAVKKKRVKELKEFREVMRKLRIKIYHIKNNSVDEIEGGDDEKAMEEDDDEIYMQSTSQVSRGLRDDDVVPDDDE